MLFYFLSFPSLSFSLPRAYPSLFLCLFCCLFGFPLLFLVLCARAISLCFYLFLFFLVGPACCFPFLYCSSFFSSFVFPLVFVFLIFFFVGLVPISFFLKKEPSKGPEGWKRGTVGARTVGTQHFTPLPLWTVGGLFGVWRLHNAHLEFSGASQGEPCRGPYASKTSQKRPKIHEKARLTKKKKNERKKKRALAPNIREKTKKNKLTISPVKGKGVQTGTE